MKSKPTNLDAYINRGSAPYSNESSAAASDAITWIARSKILPNVTMQDRDDWDSEEAIAHVEKLARSMVMKLQDGTVYGIRTPLVVSSPNEQGEYELISGENRWRAAAIAGLEELPCIIKSIGRDESRLEHTTENSLRRDLTLWQKAKAIERDSTEFALTPDQIISAHGLRNKQELSQIRSVLKLPEEAQALVRQGLVNNKDYAYELRKLDAEQLKKLGKRLEKGMSFREAANSLMPKSPKNAKAAPGGAGEGGAAESSVSEGGATNESAGAASSAAAGTISLSISRSAANFLADVLGIAADSSPQTFVDALEAQAKS